MVTVDCHYVEQARMFRSPENARFAGSLRLDKKPGWRPPIDLPLSSTRESEDFETVISPMFVASAAIEWLAAECAP
jgi:hypothetical protein